MSNQSLSDKFVSVLVNGRSIRLNIMQPLNVEFSTDASETLSKRSNIINENFKLVSMQKVSFPKTNIRSVERVQLSAFEFPESYIKFRVKSAEEMDNIVEYEIDEEDLAWLEELKLKIGLELSDGIFEQAMDRLEKDCFFQGAKEGIPFEPIVDEDARCCVCNSGEVDNTNQIIFCDLCNIAVHQECYGVPYVPEGQWLCRRCQLSPSKPVKCVLCPGQLGAFKQTVRGGWAHVVCALYLNEVHFSNVTFMEPIDGIENSIRRRCKLRCNVCKKRMGACLQCSKKSCTRSFHVTCGRAAGLEMRTEEVENPKRGVVEIRYHAFCHIHSSDLNNENSMETSKGRKRIEESMRVARQKLQENLTVQPPVNEPRVSAMKLKEIRKNLEIEKDLMHYIAIYWKLKRKSRCGVPLLRRLMPGKSCATSYMPKNEHTEDANAFGIVRAHLERTRLLCELVVKREKLKKSYYSLSKDLVICCITPLRSILNDLLDKIERKDRANVFARPVSDEDVPGYSAIIKRPMDITAMRRKISKGLYKELSQMKADFTLMMSNCAKFNRENMYFLNYGSRLDRYGLKIFTSAEQANKSVLMSPEMLTSIAKVALLPTKPEEECDVSDTQSKCSKSFTFDYVENSDKSDIMVNDVIDASHRKRKRNLLPQGSSAQKKLRALDKSQPPITFFINSIKQHEQVRREEMNTASDIYGLNASISEYRRGSGRKLENTVTDLSSAVEESTAGEEDSQDDQIPSSSNRKRIRPLRTPDTVEIVLNFQHNDLVWVITETGRMIGRVIDLRMRFAVEDLPIDYLLEKRPTDLLEPKLVQLFTDPVTWKWIECKSLTHCADLDLGLSDLSPQLITAVNKARAFLTRRIEF